MTNIYNNPENNFTFRGRSQNKPGTFPKGSGARVHIVRFLWGRSGLEIETFPSLRREEVESVLKNGVC